jgi:Cft2 family RNA processing exonuclease
MLLINPPRVSLNAGGIELSLDRAPRADAEQSATFVSHAHFDHAPSLKKAKKVLASRATVDLLEARGLRVEGSVAQEFSNNGFHACLLDSGHVLGSSMLFAQDANAGSFLYSSDFKLGDSLTARGAKPRSADTLLVESTYGLPGILFPQRTEVYKQISDWVAARQREGIVLLGGYALGKSQELIACLNEYAGIAPVVTKEVSEVSDVYKKHGVKLNFIPADSWEGERELKRNFVAVMPMHLVSRTLALKLCALYGKKVSIAAASGWALFQRFSNFDAAFALSDHADFNELTEFVEGCSPKKVFCTHGFAEEFARELRKKGFDASALNGKASAKESLAAFC